MLLIYILIANSSLSKSEPQISSDDLDLFNPFQNRMNTHYHDAALGSWDLQVKALGYMARRQAWGSTLFLQITYAGIKKKNQNRSSPSPSTLSCCFTAEESGTTLLLFQKYLQELFMHFASV